jgi:ribose/xylose/arabinose/galactoside ABC-type transport system permease subunit
MMAATPHDAEGRPEGRQVWERRALRRALDFAPLFLLAALLLVFSIIDPRVVSTANLRGVVVQATPVALLGLGACIVLVSAGIDLSAGQGVALCSVVMASQLVGGASLPLALAAGLAALAVLGLLNGVLIGLFHIPPFVVTLATMVAVQGATLQVARQGVLLIQAPLLRRMVLGQIAGIPYVVLLVLAIAALTWIVMRYTRFGLRTYAIGSDAAAAQLAGVILSRQLVLTYVVSALFTFLTAVLMISRVPVVTPNLGGTSLLLDALAAAVLGGTSIYGGRGTVPGVLAGALIVSLLTGALRVFGVDPSSLDLCKGAIIIVALIADSGLRLGRERLDRTAPT